MIVDIWYNRDLMHPWCVSIDGAPQRIVHKVRILSGYTEFISDVLHSPNGYARWTGHADAAVFTDSGRTLELS